MKEMTLEIEYVTECLAQSHGDRKDNTDWFKRDRENNIIWCQSWWYSAITRTVEIYEVRGVKPSMFNFCPVVETERTEVFERQYRRNQTRLHESIPVGTRVTFTAVVGDQITRSVAAGLFDKMGKYVGLSPYGHKLGYGKFNVVSIELEDCKGLADD